MLDLVNLVINDFVVMVDGLLDVLIVEYGME